MQGAQKIQDNPAFSNPTDSFRQGAREPLSSVSMLAGIGLLAPPGMSALSTLEPGVRDAQVQELLKMTYTRIKDAERQGLSYSSALWEDILGVHGTGSKRAEGPWEKRAEGVIAVAGARAVFKSVYDGARDSYSHAAKSGILGPLGEGVKSANSQAARDFAANALNEACSESVSSRDTLSQFAALANGNIERSLYGPSAHAQRLPMPLGAGLAAPGPIGLQGYRQIEISTAQALVYYFQEHPDEYDEVMVEALGLKSQAALSNSQALLKKIKARQKKIGQIAFANRVFSILASQKEKKGLLGKFLSQFGYRIDKPGRTIMVCRAGPSRSGEPLQSRLKD